MEAISIVLKENTFQFDDINYKQIQGTAMGTKMAPTYATLTMGFIETQLYERFKEKYGQDEKENFVKLFKRFLDDCFLPWQKTEAELEELHKMLNSLHPKIQFTMEYDHKKLPFLDILLYKNAERLESDIHYKQTDTPISGLSFMPSWTYKIKYSLHTGKTDLCNCNKSRFKEEAFG